MKHLILRPTPTLISVRWKLLLTVLVNLLALTAILLLVQLGSGTYAITDPTTILLVMGAITLPIPMIMRNCLRSQRLILILMLFLHGGSVICTIPSKNLELPGASPSCPRTPGDLLIGLKQMQARVQHVWQSIVIWAPTLILTDYWTAQLAWQSMYIHQTRPLPRKQNTYATGLCGRTGPTT